MTSTTASTTSTRRKGPPAPLNLASRSNSVPSVVATGPDFIEHPIPADKPAMMPRGPGSSRNIKRLSLSVSSSSNDLQTALPPSPTLQPSLPQPPPKRRSVVSLPAGASAATVLRRTDEGDASAAAYLDGPIEIMPGIWLGSEDNARDWKGLVQRGIKAILNVAKEVASPFDSSSHPSIRSVTSTPNFNTLPRYAATLQPAHLPSGRPSMHYLKLAWSHGQADLVRSGFAEAMSFVDEALDRHQGVLIHCQCGVSRSATMVIALVMRAATIGGSNIQPEVLALRGKGMQGAYDYVQKKSKSIGPNMSLIYQLLDYERALRGGDSPGRSSVAPSEDEEWERRRQEVESPDEESREILKEAKELDREMEERRARKLSLASNSSTNSFTGAVGNGAPWRVRYGSGVHNRSRAASIESNYTSVTSVSAFSDVPLEEEDEDDDNDPTKATTPDTDATDDDAHCFVMHPPPHTAVPGSQKGLPPPSAPPSKTSFGLPPPSASAHRQSFNLSPPRNASSSLSVTQSRSDADQASPQLQKPPFKKEKRRPPPLKDVSPVIPFPSVQIVPEKTDHKVSHRSSISSTSSGMVSSTSSSRSRRLSARLSSFVPFPIRTALSGGSTSEAAQPGNAAPVLPTPSATQTLFVFPPSPRARGASTPSTLTLVCTPLLTPSFTGIGNQTPRAGVFRKRTDSRKSWIGLSAVTPTTATARVDARGLFESK